MDGGMNILKRAMGLVSITGTGFDIAQSSVGLLGTMTNQESHTLQLWKCQMIDLLKVLVKGQRCYLD